MKSGLLRRYKDVSNVSGTGDIAELAIASDGRVAVFWPEPNPSVAFWPSIEAVIKVHGHEGKTVVIILEN
jgi:hypothetical protein